MKVTIYLMGKTEEMYLTEGINAYLSRLKHYLRLDWVILPDIKQGALLPKEKLKAKEGELLLSKIRANDFVVLLDERGIEVTSSSLADYIKTKMNSGTKSMIFIVGGAFGVSEEVKARADFILALSKLTLSHQMVRLIIVEQLYRAMTILRGEKYHHE